MSDLQKQTLRDVGDSLQLAIASSVTQVEFSENEVLYKKVDTLGTEIYVFSTHPDSAIYRLSFSNVGANNGSYSQQNSTVNGKVYAWVGPGNGTHEPLVLLVAPKRKQVVSLEVNIC